MQDAQPGPILLDPYIAEQIFPVDCLAISLHDALGVVRHDGYFSIIIDSEMMAVLFHGMHLENSGLKTGFNYVRNSVKVTVDAYQGTVTFYVFDKENARPSQPGVQTTPAPAASDVITVAIRP